MGAARPVDDWLADPATPPELRAAPRDRAPHPRVRLAAARRCPTTAATSLRRARPALRGVERVRRARVLGRAEAGVLSRSPAASATAASSPRRTRAATRDKLREEGYDVYLGGVPAYSTLGWFDDPLLSTFIRYPDAQLARLVFHELAHQVRLRARATPPSTSPSPWRWRRRACGAGSRPRGARRARRVPRRAGAPARVRRARGAGARAAGRGLPDEAAARGDAGAQARRVRAAARRLSRRSCRPSRTTPSWPRSRLYTELVPAVRAPARRERRRPGGVLRAGRGARRPSRRERARRAQVSGMSTIFLNAGRCAQALEPGLQVRAAPGRSIGTRIQRCTSQPSGMSPMVKALPAT